MQLTDQPIDPGIPCQQGNTLSLSVITDTIEKAQTIYEKFEPTPIEQDLSVSYSK